MTQTADVLPESPLFEGLTVAEAARLSEGGARRSFQREERLMAEGEEAPGLYLITAGSAAVTVDETSGRGRQVGLLGPGDVVGEMAIVSGQPCSATVRALADTDALLISREALLAVLEESPRLWQNIGRILSGRLARTSHELAAGLRHNVAGLVTDLPPNERLSLGAAVAASLARQAGRRVLLLVDGEPPDVWARFEPLAAPGLVDITTDPPKLKAHEAPPEAGGALSGARIALGAAPGASGAQRDEALRALELHYDEIIWLRGTGEPAGAGVSVIPKNHAVVAHPAGGLPAWVKGLEGGKEPLEAAVFAKAPGAARFIEALEQRTPHAVLRLQIDGGDVPPPLEPGSGEFRDAVDRIARQIGGMEFGLALGAGAAKGFAHIGVLRVLQENSIPVDYVSGCSIGAVVGGGFAGGMTLPEIYATMDGADRKLKRWTLPIWSIWSDRGLSQLLSENGASVRFSELPIPFAAVACDMVSGREVAIRRGIAWKGVRASVSVPGMFPAAILGSRRLVDGGLVSPVPTQCVRELGADVVIAVDLMSPEARARMSSRARPRPAKAHCSRPHLVEMLWRSMEIMQEEITIRSVSTADVTIEPDLGRVRWADFSTRGQEMVESGAAAAEAMLPAIRRLVPGAILRV